MKTKILVLILSAALMLSACSILPGAAATATESGAAAAEGIIQTNYPNALPVDSQMALGMLKLKDTADAVTAEQAAALLPLWQALRTMASATKSPSPLEVKALTQQIQDTLKPSQLQAIAGYKLTQADAMAVIQAAGLGNGFGGNRNGTPVARTPGANRGGNGGQGGGPGGFGGFIGGPGGGAGGGASTVSPSIQATAQARASSQNQFGNPLYFSVAIGYLTELVTPQGGPQGTPQAVQGTPQAPQGGRRPTATPTP